MQLDQDFPNGLKPPTSSLSHAFSMRFEAIELDTCRQLFRAWDPRFGWVEGLLAFNHLQRKDLKRTWMHGHVCVHTRIYIVYLYVYIYTIYIVYMYMYICIEVNNINWYEVICSGFKAFANRLLRVPLRFCYWLPSLTGWTNRISGLRLKVVAGVSSPAPEVKLANWWTLTVGYWTWTCSLCIIYLYIYIWIDGIYIWGQYWKVTGLLFIVQIESLSPIASDRVRVIGLEDGGFWLMGRWNVPCPHVWCLLSWLTVIPSVESKPMRVVQSARSKPAVFLFRVLPCWYSYRHLANHTDDTFNMVGLTLSCLHWDSGARTNSCPPSHSHSFALTEDFQCLRSF